VIFYFDSTHAIKEHDFIIDNSGGLHGINNIGLLQSVLDLIQNDDYYPEIQDKVTHLFYAVNKNHAFSDGNKRTSIVLSAYFLELNGFEYCVDRFIIEMENVAVHVADNRIDKRLLSEIIYSLLYEPEYTEDVQLKIITAIGTPSDQELHDEF
jgi:death-on-curing protein